MFVLKKFLTPFLLPPGIFIVGLLCSGGWLLWKKNWGGALISASIGCLMWALSVVPISDTLIRGLESGYDIPQDPSGDVIILLGAGVHGKAADLSGIGAPSEEAFGRLVTAVRLYNKLDVPIVVCGGQASKYGTAEAQVLGRFLIELGVSPDHVILEQHSRDTFENAKYAGQIVARFGFKAPLLVTSGYHMKRSVLSFNKVGMAVTPVPAGLKTGHQQIYGWNSYLPGNFKNVAKAIKEYLGILFYRLAYPTAVS